MRLVFWILGVFITIAASDDAGSKALVIPASQYFEGNDGPWSTFDLRVGTPEQYVRVLVSTAAPQSMVVFSDNGCSNPPLSKVPLDCAVSRGNLFSRNTSSSWREVGTYGINQDGVGLEANLGYELRTQVGLEHFGVGLTGPALENQTVAGFVTASPFYLGIFGLNNQPMNLSTLGNYPSQSFLTTLKAQKKIPSLSWSYTAGARYRLKQVYGQLIFSGYDRSRFTENPVSFTMAGDITRDLVVSLQSISYAGSSASTILSKSIDIYIDSTDPNLWLPAEACDAFERAFGLKLDSQSGLYLVNDTHRDALLASNAQVSFRLSDVKAGGDTVTIVLPYAAFDLTAQYPLVENATHYFPLKRANSSAQYTLGRTFLQEAYLTADYERKVFNVSACTWNQGAQENLVTISDINASPVSGNTQSTLSGGTIAGISVGVVAGLLLIVIGIVVLLRKRRKWMKVGFSAESAKPGPDMSVLNGAVFNAPQSPIDQSASILISEISDPRSHSGATRSTDKSPVGPLAGPSAVGSNANSSSTPELDAEETSVRPSAEYDPHAIPGQTFAPNPLEPVAEIAGVHELPGTDVAALKSHRELHEMRISSSSEGDASSRAPSPLVSTMDAREYNDAIHTAPVSPSSPVFHRGEQGLERNSRRF